MSNIKPEEFKRINQALIERGHLNPESIVELEAFGPESRIAYAEYVESLGVPVTVPAGTLIPSDLRDIPGDLLEGGTEFDAESEQIEQEVEEELAAAATTTDTGTQEESEEETTEDESEEEESEEETEEESEEEEGDEEA